MAKLIAKTYGGALFELAVEDEKARDFLEEFTAIYTVLKENPDLGRLLNHPKVLKDEKQEVLRNVFANQITKEMAGFLELLVTKERFGDIDAIYEYFSSQIKEALGIGVAFVTTASAISDQQKASIEERLVAVTKYNQMEMNFAVDEKLIGGMVIRIGDRVVDSSVATRLGKLKRELNNISYDTAAQA